MKKLVTSTVLAAALAVNFTGVSHAQTMPSVSKEQVQMAKQKAQELLDSVSALKADVKLKDARYSVQYSQEKGTVKVHIIKASGNKKVEVTEQQAKEKVVQFVKELNLNKQMSKEEIVQKLSAAIGVKPSDVLRTKAAISFQNNADLTFSYKKGNKEAAGSYLPNHLDVSLEGKNGEYFHAILAIKDENVTAKIEEKTSKGTKSYKGLQALLEMARLKSVLAPAPNTDLKAYLTTLSNELGIKPSELTKADIDAKFENNSKLEINFSK
ncbi:YusW family protein [Metabacillus sp. RGM 3146]|uniref:YusW family protein n=1 Tax=Metabacillus sp. RGM 3146 TaxID=3401092 RepID=UPI003B9A56F3